MAQSVFIIWLKKNYDSLGGIDFYAYVDLQGQKGFYLFFYLFCFVFVGKHRKTVGKFSFHDPQLILQHLFCHVDKKKKTHFLHFYRLLTT